MESNSQVLEKSLKSSSSSSSHSSTQDEDYKLKEISKETLAELSNLKRKFRSDINRLRNKVHCLE
ncbi:unnamed protein product [Moneuplotes crassus]|uniref:Uncharacterized protein n=1 Tax=Euplotes crassus TaxID=5936 RepID=A0AAD1U3B3_EUPCR|nr:unnamed protein product [Moneuplotes crassus]